MPKQASGNRADQLKLTFAIVALVVAGLFIAWNFGAFEGLFRKPVDPMANMTPKQQEEVQRQRKQAEEQAKITPPS